MNPSSPLGQSSPSTFVDGTIKWIRLLSERYKMNVNVALVTNKDIIKISTLIRDF